MAIAGYLVSVRGPARPAAGPATPGGEQTGAAASAARTRPLERLTNPTVERLKSFAADADAAKPSTPDAPARGVERLLSYSASGVAANSLREAAVAAAPHAARPGVPEPGFDPRERPRRGPTTPQRKRIQASRQVRSLRLRLRYRAPCFRCAGRRRAAQCPRCSRTRTCAEGSGLCAPLRPRAGAEKAKRGRPIDARKSA